jgi:hypothetical protein
MESSSLFHNATIKILLDINATIKKNRKKRFVSHKERELEAHRTR